MASRLKKFFLKSKSTTEGKAWTKLEALLSRNLRPFSQSSSRKEKKENEFMREKIVVNIERNIISHRKQMLLSLGPQKRYPPELRSCCDSSERGLYVEQRIPLLCKKALSLSETSSAPLFQSTLTGSLHQSSCESVPDSLQCCEEVASDKLNIINIQSDDLPPPENHKQETYTHSLELSSAQQHKPLERSEDLMKVLSHHQIEWTAMMELQNLDTTGILRGLSSRQIRWLVRESRCRTWLVGTLGPLLEERNEVMDLDRVNNVNVNILEEERTQDLPLI